MARARERSRKQPLVVGYLRVSTTAQDVEGQRHAVLDYAQRRGLLVTRFVEANGVSGMKGSKERRIDELVGAVGAGDTVIVSELSRLGRSTVEVLTLVKELSEAGVNLIAIKQGLVINGKGDMMSRAMVTLFSLFAEMERDLLSERTKQALARLKASGVRLGRPPGPGKSKLDGKEQEILKLLRKRVGITSLARIYDCTFPTMKNFINKKAIPMERRERERLRAEKGERRAQ